MELTKVYGQLFLTKFGSKDNGTWFKALNQLTAKALENGMERLGNLACNGKFVEYPPNCLQFKALCVSFYDDLRLPKISDAYREIINLSNQVSPRYSHELIEYVANRLPAKFYEMVRENESYPVFKEVYEQVCDLVKQGHDIKITTISKRIKQEPNPDIARSHMHQLKQHLRG